MNQMLVQHKALLMCFVSSHILLSYEKGIRTKNSIGELSEWNLHELPNDMPQRQMNIFFFFWREKKIPESDYKMSDK